MPENRKQPSRRVIITVSGGVADLIFKPAGIAITLLDYDVDGVERTSKDPDGERCIVGHWGVRRKVVANDHWPIIRQAERDITCRCTRRWKCPSCGKLIDVSYEDLAQVGTPICPGCDRAMELP